VSLRIAVLGAGGHSRVSHGAALKIWAAEHPGEIELAAVCDLDRDKATAYARDFGFAAAYADLEGMLDAEELDGLIAVTPVERTFPLVGKLLQRGIPLVIEKPPGETVEHTRQLLALARRQGTPHMISFNRRFHPGLLIARQWLGEHAADSPPRLSLTRMLRVARREENFAFWTGIHCIDATLSLMGAPAHAAARHVASPIPDRPAYVARLDLENGAAASFLLAPDTGCMQETYELFGHDYRIFLDFWPCAVTIHRSGETVLEWHAPEDAPAAYRDGSVGETDAFVRSLQGRRVWSPSLEEGLTAMRAAETVERGWERELETE